MIFLLPIVLIFVIFLFVGSFYGVLIDRSMRNEQFFNGRSYCESCKHTLVWFDLIPLLSFCMTAGKCRYCHKNLSKWLWVFELSTALINSALFYFLFFIKHTGSLELALIMIFANILWVIFISDAKYMMVPDFLFVLLIFIYIVYGFLSMYWPESFQFAYIFTGNYLFRLYGVVLMLIFFGGIFAVSRGNAMGLADVFLSSVLAMVIGLRLTGAMWIFSFYFGALYASLFLLLNKKSIKAHIPFGPFIIIGFIAAIALGNDLLYIYGF